MAVESSQDFYGRWTGLYDVLSHSTPGIRFLRRTAVQSLGLEHGDTVVDLGCGAGPNIPHLRRAVGPAGSVIGVDFTRRILERARRNHDYENVDFVHGDVTDLPIDDSVDAIFASFLAGMLPEPTATVDAWADHLRPGGTLGLLDASLSDKRHAWPLNQAVKAMVYASAPEKSHDWDIAPWTTVTQRVDLAHAEIRANARETREETRLLGTLRVTAGEID